MSRGNYRNSKKRYRKVVVRFMDHELPSISEQKTKPYRPTIGQVTFYYRLLNILIFDRKLVKPHLEIRRLRSAWGLCIGNVDLTCEIHLTDRYYCKQWFLSVLAHEMCHQYQWQILGQRRIRRGRYPIMSHGPTFFLFKEKLKRFGIPLKTALQSGRWFRLQDLTRS